MIRRNALTKSYLCSGGGPTNDLPWHSPSLHHRRIAMRVVPRRRPDQAAFAVFFSS